MRWARLARLARLARNAFRFSAESRSEPLRTLLSVLSRPHTQHINNLRAMAKAEQDDSTWSKAERTFER